MDSNFYASTQAMDEARHAALAVGDAAVRRRVRSLSRCSG
jgi:hypothetical protein